MNAQDFLSLFHLAEMDDEFIIFIATACGPQAAADFNAAIPVMKRAVWLAAKMGIDLDNPVFTMLRPPPPVILT